MSKLFRDIFIKSEGEKALYKFLSKPSKSDDEWEVVNKDDCEEFERSSEAVRGTKPKLKPVRPAPPLLLYITFPHTEFCDIPDPEFDHVAPHPDGESSEQQGSYQNTNLGRLRFL